MQAEPLSEVGWDGGRIPVTGWIEILLRCGWRMTRIRAHGQRQDGARDRFMSRTVNTFGSGVRLCSRGRMRFRRFPRFDWSLHDDIMTDIQRFATAELKMVLPVLLESQRTPRDPTCPERAPQRLTNASDGDGNQSPVALVATHHRHRDGRGLTPHSAWIRLAKPGAHRSAIEKALPVPTVAAERTRAI